MKVDISQNTKSERCQTFKCSKDYKKVLEQSKSVLRQLAEVAKSRSVAIICSCEDLNCSRFKLAEYLVNNFNCQYEGEIGSEDQNLLQNIDRLELDENVESFLYEKNDLSEEQVRQKISDIWKTEERTMSDCLNEYEETNDNFKQSLDIPVPQALIDMACMEPGYQNIRFSVLKECRDKCCKDQDRNKITNNCAGKMDMTHFNELCVSHRGRLYRLEEKSGKLPKYRDIEWLAHNIGCTLSEASQFNKAFIDINLGSSEIYKIIFGHHIGGKKSGIKNSGNKFLQQFLDLQAEMNNFKLTDKFEQYSEIENIDEDYNQEIDLTESSFDEEDEYYDSNLYTAKRLSIDEESISEEEIAIIKYGTYEQYKDVVSKYMKPSYKYIGYKKFVEDGKEVDKKMLKSAVSMAWIYLKEAKIRHKADKDKLIEDEMTRLPEHFTEAIDAYKQDPSRTNKYRITTLVHGGEWDGVKYKPATKEQKQVCWKVIYG
jgi:hypothetical protein